MTQDTPVEGTQTALTFKTEVQQLLNILANSLYTEREIFLRELLSNASDALHRIQFEMLTNRDVLNPEAELAITLDFDEEAKTLTLSDTGIGMTREELIENLGTIAHSGAMAFMKRLEEGQRPSDVIGQFGVGFYSVFMVADEVRVTSRSYQPDAQAWAWTSKGESTYSLEPAEKAERGTTVKVQLKEDAVEFASAWRLEQIVKKHSNYISFPINLRGKVVNQQTALWRKAAQEITDEDYADFYRQLTLDPEKPLLHVHLSTDAPVNVRSLLYIPGKLEQGPLRLRTDRGLKLYSKKILIQEYNKDLLPEYLRFVEGVVDSEDLPLNISRETVQSSRVIHHIQKALTKRLIKELHDVAEQSPEDYARFWKEFGAFIKEGTAMAPFDHDDLLPLLRFTSSKSGDALISLADYAGRMKEGQEALYYILGESLSAVAVSPHLDYFKTHDIEVLYLVDPLDGFMVQGLREFEGKPLKNIDDADLQLPEAQGPAEEAVTSVAQEAFDTLIARFKQVLGARVTDVRASKLLRDSPCRLVSPESGPEQDLQRVRRLIEQDFELPPKILELNRSHPLIQNLAHLIETQSGSDLIEPAIEQLFANLQLLEGVYPNPAEMVPRIQKLLEAATGDKNA